MLKKIDKILRADYKFKKIDMYKYEGLIERYYNGKQFFKYEISIDLQPVIHKKLPDVWESQGLIPNTVEYHKFIKTNTFCFGVGIYEDILFKLLKKDFRIFFEEQIVGYLFAATYKDIYGEWGAKEFSHDIKIAKKQALMTVFGFDYQQHDIKKLILNLINPKSSCFCDSNINYQDCHKKQSKTNNMVISLQNIISKIEDMYPELKLNKPNKNKKMFTSFVKSRKKR